MVPTPQLQPMPGYVSVEGSTTMNARSYSRFADEFSNSSTIAALVILILGSIFTLPLTCLRIFTKRLHEGKFGWDDWTLIIGQLGVFGHVWLILKMIYYGGGRDIWTISQSDLAQFHATYDTLQIVARIDFAVTKVSILLLFFYTFFPRGSLKNWKYWAVWLVIIFNILYALALTLSVALQCIGQDVPEGSSCVNQDYVLVIASTINVVSDIAVLIFPVMVVYGLQMNASKRIKVLVLFGFGFVAIGISVARLIWQVVHMDNKNSSQYLLTVAILAFVEEAVGILVCDIPMFPMFVRYVTRGCRSTSREGYSRSRNISGPRRSTQPGQLTTISREFRQWRARQQQDAESGTYSLHRITTADTQQNGSVLTKTDTLLSSTEIGSRSPAMSGEDHTRSNSPLKTPAFNSSCSDREAEEPSDSIRPGSAHAR